MTSAEWLDALMRFFLLPAMSIVILAAIIIGLSVVGQWVVRWWLGEDDDES